MARAYQKITKVSKTHRKAGESKKGTTIRLAYKRSGNAKRSAVRI